MSSLPESVHTLVLLGDGRGMPWPPGSSVVVRVRKQRERLLTREDLVLKTSPKRYRPHCDGRIILSHLFLSHLQ